LHHSDGTTESLSLDHSFADSQIEWFRVGSALNLFHR
jgi:aconitate hydratase